MTKYSVIGHSRPLRDIKSLAIRGSGYLVTAVVPKAADRWISASLGEAALRFRAAETARVVSRMARLLGPSANGLDLQACAVEFRRMQAEDMWGRLRGMHRRAWRPSVELEGAEHLEAALARGRGAILWRMSFCPTPVPKMALFSAGYKVVHLSTVGHGNTGSWIGRRAVAPLFALAENWYLDERILIPSDESLSHMKLLMNRLRENAVVSMFGDRMARQNIVTPFFTGSAAFATGAPSLAHREQSALLPVHAVRQALLQYRVVIDPPLEVTHGLPRAEYARQAIEQFSDLLQQRILEHPASYSDWTYQTNWAFASD